MAHLDQPLGGGDDHLRGHVRDDVPGDPRGTRLGRLLDVPDPEPDGHVAQLQEPASLGRLRGQHLRNRLGPVLVRRPDPGPGDDSRSGENPHPAGSSTASSPSDGGARCGSGITTRPPTSILAALATPLVLSVHSIVSMDFAVSAPPRMAHDGLPAVLRRGRDLLRVRHGADAHGDLPQGVPPRAHHHPPALRLHGEDHARDRDDGRLRLCHGVLHRLVQREPLRALHVPEPRARTVRLGLLDHGQLQRDQPADLLVQEGAHEHPDPVRRVDRHQHRHVVRAVRDHRDVAAPRLPALVLGLLQSHDLGRVVPARQLRALLHDVLPVRALSSDGGHRRGQDRPAAGRSALAAPAPNASPPKRGSCRPRDAGQRLEGGLPMELPDAARPAAPDGALLRSPRRIRDAGGPLSRVRARA